jgi:hypothetical protein
MNGPIKKAKAGFGMGFLELATAISGLVVVIGLVLESVLEVERTVSKHFWPTRTLWGSILVAFGVFAEVAIGIFIARSSRREQIEANERIAEANERAAKAEQATADANLAHTKLEAKLRRRTENRRLTPEEEQTVIKTLREYPPERFAVVVSSAIPAGTFAESAGFERTFFALQLKRVCSESGWTDESLDIAAGVPNLPSVAKGVVIFVRANDPTYLRTTTGVAILNLALNKLDIPCQITGRVSGAEVRVIISVGML